MTTITIDHGGVVVLDPMHADLSEADRGRVIDAAIGARMDCDDDKLPEGIDHAGVFVTTGLGDGRYPVYADVNGTPWRRNARRADHRACGHGVHASEGRPRTVVAGRRLDRDGGGRHGRPPRIRRSSNDGRSSPIPRGDDQLHSG